MPMETERNEVFLLTVSTNVTANVIEPSCKEIVLAKLSEDCNLPRDSKTEKPKQAAPKFQAHRNPAKISDWC